MQHTDREGRLISMFRIPFFFFFFFFEARDEVLTKTADPDLSNPTRHRMERPLDTIRSFEAAIDRHYRDNVM